MSNEGATVSEIWWFEVCYDFFQDCLLSSFSVENFVSMKRSVKGEIF